MPTELRRTFNQFVYVALRFGELLLNVFAGLLNRF